MQVAFFCCFRHGVAGMSRDLGRDVPDLEKLYARKLWADFSFPKRASKGTNRSRQIHVASSSMHLCFPPMCLGPLGLHIRRTKVHPKFLIYSRAGRHGERQTGALKNPEGPKIEKTQSRLKVSISLEISILTFRIPPK